MNRPEQALQRTCADYMRRCVPGPPEGPAWTAINPSPAKSKAEAGVSKAMGLNAGWPDWVMVWRGVAIFIEFKAPTKGPLSEVQRLCHASLHANGAMVRVADSFAQFQQWLNYDGIPTRVAA